jgi:hypothetical protein
MSTEVSWLNKTINRFWRPQRQMSQGFQLGDCRIHNPRIMTLSLRTSSNALFTLSVYVSIWSEPSLAGIKRMFLVTKSIDYWLLNQPQYLVPVSQSGDTSVVSQFRKTLLQHLRTNVKWTIYQATPEKGLSFNQESDVIKFFFSHYIYLLILLYVQHRFRRT